MPGSGVYPLAGYPASLAELRKNMGKASPLFDFLSFQATRDVVTLTDDFLGDAINLDNYAVANSGGSGAASFAINVQRDGVIRAATGTTDDGSCSIIGPAVYYGDGNAGIEFRVKSDVVTGYNFEVGYVDAVPAADGPAVSDVDTPAATATDCAVFTIDTDQTIATLAAVTAGSTFTTTATTLTVPITNLTAATYATFRVQLIGDNAYFWCNGMLVASHTGSKIEGGNKVAPWIYVRTRNTTTHLFDCDYIKTWALRNV